MILFKEMGRMDLTLYKGIIKHKEVDMAWKPYLVGTESKDWQTVLMECAVSQSRSSLICANS